MLDLSPNSAIARLLILDGTWDAAFFERWVNWDTFLRESRPDLEPVYLRLPDAQINWSTREGGA